MIRDIFSVFLEITVLRLVSYLQVHFKRMSSILACLVRSDTPPLYKVLATPVPRVLVLLRLLGDGDVSRTRRRTTPASFGTSSSECRRNRSRRPTVINQSQNTSVIRHGFSQRRSTPFYPPASRSRKIRCLKLQTVYIIDIPQ